MTDRLFLHIGLMKSGTTYVQNVCDAQATALQRGGLHWLLGSAGQQWKAIAQFRGGERALPGTERWDRLCEEVREHDGDTLLSHELLASLSGRQIRQFVKALPADEPHAIITVRDLSQVIPSRWQETTQNGSTIRWAEYVETVCDDHAKTRPHERFWRHADIGHILRKWRAVVPPHRIHLVTVPNAGKHPDELWRRFASVVGSDPDLGARTDVFGNASLGAVSAELMRRVNLRVEDMPWNEYRFGFKNGLAKRGLAQRRRSEPRLALPSAHWDWVERRAQRLIDEIKDVEPVVVGDLDELRPVAPKAPCAAPDREPGDTELLEAALDGLEQLGRQLTEARRALYASRNVGVRTHLG